MILVGQAVRMDTINKSCWICEEDKDRAVLVTTFESGKSIGIQITNGPGRVTQIILLRDTAWRLADTLRAALEETEEDLE